MRRIGLSILFMLCAMLAITQVYSEGPSVPSEAKISSVVVYRDAALVSRTINVHIPAGKSVVEVSNLPSWVNDTNSTVSGKGDFKLLSTEISHKIEAYTIGQNKDLKSLSEKKDALEQKISDLMAEKASLKGKETYYKSLFPKSISSGENVDKVVDLSLENAQLLLDTVEKGLSSVYSRELEIEQAIKPLRAELDVVNKKLSSIGWKINQSGGEKYITLKAFYRPVRFFVKAKEDGKITLILTSLAGNCGWSTNYDARLQENEKVSLSYFADIHQKTGENWESISMSLSTSSISEVSLPPELKKMVINLVKIEKLASIAPAGYSSDPQYGTPAPTKRYKGKRRAPKKVAAKAFGGGMAVQFAVPTPSTVPGDGNVRRLLITRQELGGVFEYEATPRIEKMAFARMEIVNTSGFPFVAGTLRAFSGGEFLGTTHLKDVSTNEKFKMYFGNDPRVEVKYRSFSRKIDEGRKYDEIDFTWLLEITNNREKEIVLNLYDALPKPANEEIRLKKVKFSTKPNNDWEEDENRLLSWMLSIPAGEKIEIKVSFRLVVPADKELIWQGLWEGGEK